MTVKDYVRGARVRVREMFVPLLHPPGHAQVDFGEAFGIIGGIKRKVHFFCLDLPHSDACFVKGFVDGGGDMSGTSQVLLGHHLKTLKLPTFLREYDKVAQQCAAESMTTPVISCVWPNSN